MNDAMGEHRDAVRNTLRSARVVALALAVGVALWCAVAWWLSPLGAWLTALAVPVALAGLISPVAGYRAYHGLRDRIPTGADLLQRCEAFRKATVVGLAITEGVALLGVVVYLLSGDSAALVGVVTHWLLTGAIWPSPRRLESFLEGGTFPDLPE